MTASTRAPRPADDEHRGGTPRVRWLSGPALRLHAALAAGLALSSAATGSSGPGPARATPSRGSTPSSGRSSPCSAPTCGGGCCTPRRSQRPRLAGRGAGDRVAADPDLLAWQAYLARLHQADPPGDRLRADRWTRPRSRVDVPAPEGGIPCAGFRVAPARFRKPRHNRGRKRLTPPGCRATLSLSPRSGGPQVEAQVQVRRTVVGLAHHLRWGPRRPRAHRFRTVGQRREQPSSGRGGVRDGADPAGHPAARDA